MPTLVLSLFGFVRLLLSGHVAIAMENAALRVQLVAFQRKRKRPTLTSFDRLFWVGLSLLWTGCVACLVLDLKMPGMNGLDVQRVVSVQISTAIIFITGRGDVPSTVKAMQGGAVDFLRKPIDEAVLMAAVEQVLQKDRIARQQALEDADLLARYRSLTAWEKELLPPLVQGLLNKQAAADLGIAEYTVQIHRGNIMRKMKADPSATLVRLATKVIPDRAVATGGDD